MIRRGFLLVLAVVVGACSRQALPSRPTVLWFGGDVHFGVRAVNALVDLDLDGPLVVNLEGPIGTESRASTKDALFNPPDAAVLLRRAKVVAAGVDNNHSFDDGEMGAQRTRLELERAGVRALGSATLGGVKVVQIDLSRGVPEGLETRLRQERADIVLFHVLAPPLYLPEPELRTAVEMALRAGASAVLAHGSHSLAPVERRGNQVVAWGLGNLAFDCDCTAEDEGLLVRLEFDGHQLTTASVALVRAGLSGRRAALHDDALSWQLLESLGSTHLTRRGSLADF